MRPNLKIKTLSVVIGASLASSVVTAGVLEEVVVTAQKREQSIQDVGIAITAFTGEQTDALGWESSEDIAAQTPGLITASFSGDSSVSFFVVRGIGQADYSDNQEAPTVVYEDGAYIANTGAAAVQLYDTDRIETLKGPQGTLFGRNATGGLVHIINRKPTEDFEAYADIEVAEHNSIRVEGAVSGALTDNIQGRLSFLKHDANGWIDNPIGRDMRETDDMSIRAQLQSAITDRLSANVVLTYSNVDKASGGTYTPVLQMPGETYWSGYQPGNDKHEVASNSPGWLDKEGYNFTATLTYDLSEKITLTSVTNYQDNRKAYFEDSDASPNEEALFITDQDAQTFGQEIRLNGTTDRSTWVAGVYYLDIKGDYFATFRFPDYFGLANISTLGQASYDQDTQSIAVFGQMDYELTDSLSVTAGVRYTRDEKDIDITASCASGPNPITGVANPTVPNDPATWGFYAGLGGCDAFGITNFTNSIADAGTTTDDRADEDVTAKIQLDWRLNDNTLVYAGFNRGMKAGGYTVSSDGATPQSEIEFEKEVLHAYEVGIKTDLLDGKMRVNASTFYYDYNDYQAFAFIGTSNVVFNRDARIYGSEIEIMAQPMEGLDVMLGLSTLETTVDNVPTVGDQEMLLAPEMTANLLVRKEWDMSNGGSVAFQVDGVYVAEQSSNAINGPGSFIASYDVWNARLSYKHSENWDAALFVRNLGDEEYYTYAFEAANVYSTTGSWRAYNAPRIVGASFKYRW